MKNFLKTLKKYKPIRIFNTTYGYGWWWKDYFFFIGKHATTFAIIPMWNLCCATEYVCRYSRFIIGDGDCKSWSEYRQEELRKFMNINAINVPFYNYVKKQYEKK